MSKITTIQAAEQQPFAGIILEPAPAFPQRNNRIGGQESVREPYYPARMIDTTAIRARFEALLRCRRRRRQTLRRLDEKIADISGVTAIGDGEAKEGIAATSWEPIDPERRLLAARDRITCRSCWP